MAKKKKAEPEKASPPVKIERFAQSMMVALKPAEVAERADRAAHLIADRDHLRAEMKMAAKANRARIEELGTEMRRLSSEVREKVTYRDVACERQFHYNEKLVRDVRSDTGEVFAERAMTEQECQRQFEFPEGAPPGPAGDVDDEFGDEKGGEE
jgi:hypothetical protein